MGNEVPGDWVLGGWAPRYRIVVRMGPPFISNVIRPFVRGPTTLYTSRSLGDLRSPMVINHLLTGMMLQGWGGKGSQVVVGLKPNQCEQ